MMDIEEIIQTIVDNGRVEDMRELSDILEDVLEVIENYDKDCYDKYAMKLYVLAYGKVLTDNMKREWVKKMRPMSKWTEEEVKNIVNQYGFEVPYMSAFVILNMLYSDMESAFGDGNDEESLKRYLRGTRDWYFDEDAKVDGEEKLFNYKMYIVE
jgi:hypothetical protein